MSQAPTVGPGLKNLSVLLVMTSPECLHDNQGRGAGSPLWVPFLLSSSSHHFDVSIWGFSDKSEKFPGPLFKSFLQSTEIRDKELFSLLPTVRYQLLLFLPTVSLLDFLPGFNDSGSSRLPKHTCQAAFLLFKIALSMKIHSETITILICLAHFEYVTKFCKPDYLEYWAIWQSVYHASYCKNNWFSYNLIKHLWH